jgi:hypothetical protein
VSDCHTWPQSFFYQAIMGIMAWEWVDEPETKLMACSVCSRRCSRYFEAMVRQRGMPMIGWSMDVSRATVPRATILLVNDRVVCLSKSGEGVRGSRWPNELPITRRPRDRDHGRSNQSFKNATISYAKRSGAWAGWAAESSSTAVQRASLDSLFRSYRAF